MPFDGNGNASVNRNTAVTGQTVLAEQVNTPFADIQSMLGQVLLRSGVAPMTGPLNMNGFKITNNPEAISPTDFVILSQIQSLINDPWAFQPIGTIIQASPWGFTAPPKNLSYRYVLLTAGLSGSGGYNEGVLTTENVSGSRPTVTATAVVSLVGSPLNGMTIRLLNTEERFLRGAYEVAGTLQDSDNLSHGHGVNDPTHSHSLTPDNLLIGQYNGSNQDLGSGPNGSRKNIQTAPASTGISIQNSGATESRPRNMSINYYLRIL